MTRETVVVIVVLDDEPGREWWQAMGLPDPAYWSTDLGERVAVSVELEKQVRG